MSASSPTRRLVAIAVLAALILGVLGTVMALLSSQAAPGPAPAAGGPSRAGSSSADGSAAASPRPSPSIAQADPVALRIPRLEFEKQVLLLPAEHADPIDPPTLADVFWDAHPVITDTPKDSYAPGTDAPDLVVFAGHTSNQAAEAALNPLWDWADQTNRLSVGDELWVRTTASGEDWLIYRLQAIHTPSKGTGPDSLAASTEIWGTDEQPRPGHLLLIGCLQKATVGEASTANIVWDFAFDRVSR